MDIVLEGFKEALRLIVTLDNEVFEVVILSLKVSLISLAVAVLLSLPLGIIIARYEFFGKRMLLRLIYTLMGMPPVLCGLFVYILFMRRGPLGSLRLNYTVTAMVIAQIFLMIPILTGLTINAARERQEQITMLAKTLGSNADVFFRASHRAFDGGDFRIFKRHFRGGCRDDCRRQY